MRKLIVFLSFVYLVSISSYSTLPRNPYIDSKLDFFSYYLDGFPPRINQKDSLDIFKDKLLFFINMIDNLKDKIVDKSYYYMSLGKAYRFAHNLDIDSAWIKSELYLKKSLEYDNSNPETKYQLAILYSSTAPQYLHVAYQLFKELIKINYWEKEPYLPYNIVLVSILFNDISLGRWAVNLYHHIHPEDTLYKHLKEMIDSRYAECITIDTLQNTIIYENVCAGYKVRYSKKLEISDEKPFNKVEGLSLFALRSPKIYSEVLGDSINSGIGINGISPKRESYWLLLDNFCKKLNANMDSTRYNFKDSLKSVYISFQHDETHKYKGIITSIKRKGLNYVLSYISFEDTFDPHFSYYKEIENNFNLIPFKSHKDDKSKN